MKCYYAHCIAIYDTPQEKRDIQTLEELGFEVDNPNCEECAQGYEKEGMKYFEGVIARNDILAFRALPDGRIPAGIAKEIDIARNYGKLVIELPSSLASRKMDVEQTREYLEEVGHR